VGPVANAPGQAERIEMQFETILFEQNDEGVATITLNRPHKLNAFNQLMIEEMAAAWKIVAETPEIKAAVLRAAPGKAFCVGVDITDYITLYPEEPFRERSPAGMIGPKSNFVWKPVIAAINGLCGGGAFYFINQADILICSEDAEFFDPHLSFGLVPACEPIGVSHRMPYGEIMRMILLANKERICAETAHRISLVTEVLPYEKLWDRAAELASIIASRPTRPTQAAVQLMWESLDLPYSAAVRNSYKFLQVGGPKNYWDRSGYTKEMPTTR